ncbi:hypothetical protein LSAT2_029181 [Lamellibrachia satsuma]|nr:hypothetical protein LSAT2_029181 [Lamellibrachia satsuma]
MPAATVTIRKLKNKESCVDLSVPTNKEIPGLVTVTVEYHVVVVSDQAVFKSPKHKDTDVVQFMISKHYEDFENLRRKLVSSFHGTSFPQLPKKSFFIWRFRYQ